MKEIVGANNKYQIHDPRYQIHQPIYAKYIIPNTKYRPIYQKEVLTNKQRGDMNCGSKQRKSVARRQAGCQSGRVCNFGLKSDTREMRGVWSACKHFGPNSSARASTPHLPAMTATHLNTSLVEGYFGCFTQWAHGTHQDLG